MNGHVGIGVIGAGTISDQYLTNLTHFPDLRVLAIGDVIPERAQAKAAAFDIPTSGDPDVVLRHPDVEIVVNLTIPAAHVDVSLAALEAGKHVWTEKPFGLDRAGGRALLDLARDRGLRIGSATDTFLGPGLQNTQRLLNSGAIGRPVSVITMMQDPGPESWHPDPAFLYAHGAGPLWDRGPYYLTMFTQLFGPTRQVAAATTTAFPTRTIGSGPKAGEVFPVTVPTNVAVLTHFHSGVVAQSTHSFESSVLRMGWIEVTGTEGTMAIPDPNNFTGDVLINRARSWTLEELIERGASTADHSTWERFPSPATRATRGTGVLEMARAIKAGVPHRATGELGYHVLDTLIAISESAEHGAFVPIESTVDPIPPLPVDWDPYARTLR